MSNSVQIKENENQLPTQINQKATLCDSNKRPQSSHQVINSLSFQEGNPTLLENTLMQKNQNLQEQILLLTRRIKYYEEEYISKNQTFANNAKIMAENESLLNLKLSEKDNKIELLNKENEMLKKKISEMDNDFKHLNEQFKSLGSNLNNNSENMENLGEISSVKEYANKLEQELKEVKGDNLKLVKENESLNEKNNELCDKNKRLVKENEEIKGANRGLNEQILELNQQLIKINENFSKNSFKYPLIPLSKLKQSDPQQKTAQIEQSSSLENKLLCLNDLNENIIINKINYILLIINNHLDSFLSHNLNSFGDSSLCYNAMLKNLNNFINNNPAYEMNLNKIVNSLEKIKNNFNEALLKKDKEVNDLSSLYKEKDIKINELKIQNKILKENNSILETNNLHLTAENSQLLELKSSHENTIGELTAAFSKEKEMNEKFIQFLSDQIQDEISTILKNNLLNLMFNKANLSTQINVNFYAGSSLEEKQDSLVQSLVRVFKFMSELKVEYVGLYNSILNSGGNEGDVNNSNALFIEKINDLSESLLKIQSTSDALKLKLSEAEKLNNNIEKEKKELEIELNETQQKYSNLYDNYQKLISDNIYLQSQLESGVDGVDFKQVKTLDTDSEGVNELMNIRENNGLVNNEEVSGEINTNSLGENIIITDMNYSQGDKGNYGTQAIITDINTYNNDTDNKVAFETFNNVNCGQQCKSNISNNGNISNNSGVSNNNNNNNLKEREDENEDDMNEITDEINGLEDDD